MRITIDIANTSEFKKLIPLFKTFTPEYKIKTHDTYPYKPDIIRYVDKIYILKNKLECSVEYEDNSYIIANNFLDITVWGNTRDEAEEAFVFMFDSIYNNYALESDKNLSDNAKELKKNILSLIKEINEGSKSKRHKKDIKTKRISRNII